VKYGKLKELFRIFTIERNKLASEYAYVKDGMKNELTLIFSKSGDVFNSISSLLREIEYFGYFLSEDEIQDENILKFCIPRINETFNSLLLYLQTTKGLKLSWEVSKDLEPIRKVVELSFVELQANCI
jgi:hypothetical protein